MTQGDSSIEDENMTPTEAKDTVEQNLNDQEFREALWGGRDPLAPKPELKELSVRQEQIKLGSTSTGILEGKWEKFQNNEGQYYWVDEKGFSQSDAAHEDMMSNKEHSAPDKKIS